MILKKITLHNIRSYLSETVTFEEGSTLLSGDIGSGKSTILLAVEFALFGVAKGMLSGETLLRFGEKEGSVELHCELTINGAAKEMVIQRTLKRTKDAVAQTPGYLIFDGEKTELSPVELRSKVLDLLGYPETLLTKNKSLIFRYSVYTPQEEMKQIILEDRETRLITLRQIFNIDKYKRIVENAQIYIRHLREQKRFHEGKSASKEEREQEKKAYEEKRKELQERLKEHALLYGHATSEFEMAQNSLKDLESVKIRKEKLEKVIALEENDQRYASSRMKEYEGALLTLEKEKAVLAGRKEEAEKLSGRMDKEALRSRQDALEKRMLVLEKEIQHALKNSSVFQEKVKDSQELITKIGDLENCPLCLQEVSHTHKEQVSSTEKAKVQKFAAALKETAALMATLQEEKKGIEKDLKEVEREKHEYLFSQQNLRHIVEKMEEKEQGIRRYAEAKKKAEADMAGKQKTLETHRQEAGELSFDESSYAKLKKEHDAKLQVKHRLEVEQARLEKEMQSYTQMLQKTDAALKEIGQSLDAIGHLNALTLWFEEYFIGLMDSMEKHIMQNLHHNFSDHFSAWFDMLIEDESLKVRIDDEFTPLVQHQGYDIEIEALSGGERTSVALAYRLALNMVISTLIDDIKTKDIIILDEPTDGFSTEQLDRLKEVLETLKTRQILLVSHEQKIESFVEHVIRVEKNNNQSRIVS